MSPARSVFLLLLVAAGAPRPAGAQVPLPEPGTRYSSSVAVLSQDVVVSVSAINEIALSLADVTLTVAASGGGTAQAQDATTTYGITTNGSGKKITGVLSAPYADGVTLGVALQAPTGATATGHVLGTAPVDLVVGVARVAASDLSVTYTATADATATPGPGETRTVTFTLTDG